MHENDSSWNRHKSPRLQLYASLGIHKNLPMFLEKPPEEIIKTSRCFLESFGTLYSNDYTLPQSLKSIERGVFWRCSSLDSIRIPRNVHEIGQFCLMECNSIKDVYDEAQEPQRVVKLFGKETASHVTLHVPAISLEAYKNAECWNEVKCIVPTPGK